MDKKDTRPYEVRLKEFQDALTKICRVYRIEILPTIGSTPQAIIAQMRFIDMNDPEVMKRYGLKEIAETAPENKTNTNPVRN